MDGRDVPNATGNGQTCSAGILVNFEDPLPFPIRSLSASGFLTQTDSHPGNKWVGLNVSQFFFGGSSFSSEIQGHLSPEEMPDDGPSSFGKKVQISAKVPRPFAFLPLS